MVHQIELRPDIEARVQAKAHAQGIEPESFIRNLVEDAVRPTIVAPRRAGHRNMEDFFRGMAANSDKIPQLPDEAFARESFYQDHD